MQSHCDALGIARRKWRVTNIRTYPLLSRDSKPCTFRRAGYRGRYVAKEPTRRKRLKHAADTMRHMRLAFGQFLYRHRNTRFGKACYRRTLWRRHENKSNYLRTFCHRFRVKRRRTRDFGFGPNTIQANFESRLFAFGLEKKMLGP